MAHHNMVPLDGWFLKDLREYNLLLSILKTTYEYSSIKLLLYVDSLL